MKLKELQEILGSRIKIATNDELPIEQKREEAEISQTVVSLAKQMINNADIVLRTNKLMAEGLLVDSEIERMI